MLLPGLVYGQQADSTYSSAVQLYQTGRPLAAIDILEELRTAESTHREASLLLGHLLLTKNNDDKAAEEIIHAARAQYPGDIDFEALDLLHRYKNPPLLLPNVHIGRIRNTAKGILRADSSNGIAHLVLGSLAAERFTSLRHAVSMPGFSESSLDGINVSAIQPVFVEGNNRKQIEYQARGLRNEREAHAVSRSDAAGKHFHSAEQHLLASIGVLPIDKEAYRLLAHVYVVNESFDSLLELSDRLMASRPWDSDGRLYRGLALYRLDRYQDAADIFDEAIESLTEDEALLFASLSSILNGDQDELYQGDPAGFAHTFWLLNDPRYLTDYNERELEHYSRLVYADIRFGGMLRDTRGWDTEPGQVIVRYGIPSAEAKMSSATDSYMMLVYPEFAFRFMDLAKAGKYTFFSPKASGAPSFEAIRRAWNDDTIRSKEIFSESPQITRYDEAGRHIDPVYSVAYFRDESTSMTDVVVSIDVPPDARGQGALDSGVFLLKDGDVIKSLAQSDALQPGQKHIVSHTVTAPGGQGLVSVEFETAGPAAGDQPVAFGKTSLEIPGFNTSPAVSSLLVANLVEETSSRSDIAGLSRNGHSILPTVNGEFVRGNPLYVYFEIYNLARTARGDHSFLVEAFMIEDRKERGVEPALKRLRRRNTGRGVAVSFESSIPYPNEALYLVIDTETTRLGPHILAIRIIDQTTGNSSYSAIPVDIK